MTEIVLSQTKLMLAKRLRTLRLQNNMSQETLAHEADIDRTNVSQLERALVNPSLAVIVRLVCSLDTPVIQLLSEE